MAYPDGYVGEIRLFAGTYAPAGWALCDGSSLSRTSYQNLFSVILYTYGGSGETFNLPDLRGRVPVHAGTGPGLTQRSCGQSLGAENVQLTVRDIERHRHDVCLAGADTKHSYGGTASTPNDNYLADSVELWLYSAGEATEALNAEAIEATGAPSPIPHENMMPTLFVNFIIALDGAFPAEGQE